MPESIGNAYLNVVPKVDANGPALGQQFGEGFGGRMQAAVSTASVAVGNIISDMVANVASSVGLVFSDTFNSYADYEQLVGGVDTLFKDSSAAVQENAKQAFRTVGMSANDYMENVTSFSASLLQSLDGDTAKAASIADMAMRDMSDNANKMGTDMQSITNAYQGFAKQNYTMLDNLKLGYGGTKEEMQRLLDDAGKIAGTKFDISSYSDVIEAIHVMQQEMDITGTTMEEGSSTISGSISQLQGAWTNFLTALGDGGATMDFDEVTKNLVDSLVAVGSNAVPAIGRMLASVVAQVPSLVAQVGDALSTALVDAVTNAFGKVAGGEVTDALGEIGEVISEVSGEISSAVADVWPSIAETIGNVARTAVQVVQAAWPVIKSVVTTVSTAIGAVVRTVWPVIATVINGAVSRIKTIINGLKPILGVVKGIFDGIKNAIKNPIEAARDVIKKVIDKIKSIFDGLHLEIPKPKIPKITIDGGEAPWGIAGKGRLPSFHVSWAAQGGFVGQPTLLGAGEKYTEMVLPQRGAMMDKFASAISDKIGGGVNVVLNYTGSSDPDELVNALTGGLRQLRATGAI